MKFINRIRQLDPAARKVMILSFLSIAVGNVGALIMVDRAEKRMDAKHDALMRRYKLYVEAFGQMESIAKDITLSGAEREKRIAEILRFLEIVVNEDPS